MIIALSSEAAPRASLTALTEACVRRGIQALQLTISDAHELQAAAEAGGQNGIRVIALNITTGDKVSPEQAALVSAQLGAVVFENDALAENWRASFQQRGGVLVRPLELDPQRANVAEQFAESTESGELPSHIMLRGGGPEAAQFEGRGIGTLMARLTVAGYAGTLIIAPSARAVLPVWNTWLMLRSNWGCGSKTADSSLVSLT